MNEISLLDYFAGKALVGLVTAAELEPQDAANISYDYAQAMVKERCKRQGHTKGQDLWDGGKWIGYMCPVCGEKQKEDKR